MPRLIIPLVAALIGLTTLIASGTFSERSHQASSGDAFIALLHASHAAAVAEKGPTRTR
ncbi:hypothetical protein [Elioraea rosea]|uniref:hypothetical protein n=1 Tax=Elioraea rosea TaxID=2492390 RepID=UPI0013153B69|nr:hypothetical protein [Elioraea rosea]